MDANESPAQVVFCVTCLKREPQLITAMLANCCLWWPLRLFWKLVIVTFGDDIQLHTNMQSLFRVAIDIGCVILVSGGEEGIHQAKSKEESALDKPSWMPKLPVVDAENLGCR